MSTMNEKQIRSLIKEEIAKDMLSSVLEEQLMSKFLNYIKSKLSPADQPEVEQAVDGALEELDGPVLNQFLKLVDKNVKELLDEHLQEVIEAIIGEAIAQAYEDALAASRGN